jgi:chromosome segregation ATPase
VKNSKVILIIFLLLGISIFSVFKYFLALKEKNDLLFSLERMKAETAALEKEKQNLLENEKALQQKLAQENSVLKENLRASEDKLVKLDADFTEAQQTIEDLHSRFSILEAENTALREEKENLKVKLAEVAQDNARLNSLAELKKAIKELKKKMRRVKREIRKKTAAINDSEWNSGFLVRNGKSTYPAKVKIEVRPILPHE